jgi:hypothetical protein
VFTRVAMALATSRGDLMDASGYAKGRWGEASSAAKILKAAVSAGSLKPGSDWGPALVDFEIAQAEFFALVRERSAVGRLSTLRRTPFNTRLVNQTGSTTAGWVAEGKPIPLTRMSFEASTMTPLKLAAIAVISAELARSSSPDAEATIRNDLVAATATALDAAFFDSANAGVADLRPAAVTYGADATTGSATDPYGVKELIKEFAGDLERAVLVASPQSLAEMAGQDAPNVGARGGEIYGVPAIPSAGIGTKAALIDPGGIAFADDGGTVDASDQTSLEMSDTPTAPATAATVMTSLWQMNATAIRVVHYTNWKRIQPSAVRLLGA